MPKQSGEARMIPYTSQIAEEASFLQLPYLEHDFMIKLNLLEILETSQERTRAMLVKLEAFIPRFNQFHPGCYYHIASLDSYF